MTEPPASDGQVPMSGRNQWMEKMVESLIVLAIGLTAGVLGGFFGLGGGVLIVPALVLLLPLDAHVAIGTSLGAMLAPVGLLGAWEYYRHDDVNITYAALIALGLFLGAYFGARIAVNLPSLVLRRAFAVFLVLIAARMFFR